MPSLTAEAAFMPEVVPTPTLYSFQKAGSAEAIAPSLCAVLASSPASWAVDVTADALVVALQALLCAKSWVMSALTVAAPMPIRKPKRSLKNRV